MDESTSNQFIASLVKSLQALCNGYVNFSSSIEVIGHIHLNIDSKVKLDYVLTEEVSRTAGEEDATLFSSHSYHSKPPPELICQEQTKPESATALNSSSTVTGNRRRKTQHVPRVDDSESFTFATVSQVTDHSQARSNSPDSVEAQTERTDASFSDSIGMSDDSSSFQCTEKDTRPTVAASASSVQFQRRRKSSASDAPVPVKQKRPSIGDSSLNFVEAMQIKEEPEDDSFLCHSSSDVTSERDVVQCTDFSAVVVEPVDEKEIAEFQTEDQNQEVHHQPYPISLHSGSESAQSAISLPSTSVAAVPSTSADTTAESSRKEQAVETRQTSVQTPYTRTYTKKRGRKAKKKGKRAPEIKMTYCDYTTEDMNEAIELVHGGMSVIDAALKYGIPRATLFNRSREGCKTHTGRCSEVFMRTHVGRECSRKRVKSHYTPDTVEKAIEEVHNGMPVIDAAILFDIPRATLFIRSAKGCPGHKGRCATVSTNGKLKRTKVSRFRYLKLMQQKSKGELSVCIDDDLSVNLPGVTDSGSMDSPGLSPKVTLKKILHKPDLHNEDDDEASDIQTGSLEPSGSASRSRALRSSGQLFETLGGNFVVKIERDVDE